MPRQQTSAEAAVQNLCNSISRELGIRSPIIQLRDAQFFSYQKQVEHKLAEYQPSDNVLLISPELVRDKLSPEEQETLVTAPLLKFGLWSGDVRLNLLEATLRHHLLHVHLWNTNRDENVALSHGTEFIDAASKLNIPAFEIQRALDAAIANSKARTASIPFIGCIRVIAFVAVLVIGSVIYACH